LDFIRVLFPAAKIKTRKLLSMEDMFFLGRD